MKGIEFYTTCQRRVRVYLETNGIMIQSCCFNEGSANTRKRIQNRSTAGEMTDDTLYKIA